MRQLESSKHNGTGAITIVGEGFTVVVSVNGGVVVEYPEKTIYLSRHGKIKLLRKAAVPPEKRS